MQGLVFGFLYKFIGEIDARMSASVILADLIHFGCYFWVFLKNPGLAVFSGLRAPANISWQQKRKYYCKRCKLVRWVGVEHCYDCDVCIEDLDHHCPWTTKCVGKDNLYWFYGFVFTTLFLLFYVIFVACLSLPKTVNRHH